MTNYKYSSIETASLFTKSQLWTGQFVYLDATTIHIQLDNCSVSTLQDCQLMLKHETEIRLLVYFLHFVGWLLDSLDLTLNRPFVVSLSKKKTNFSRSRYFSKSILLFGCATCWI